MLFLCENNVNTSVKGLNTKTSEILIQTPTLHPYSATIRPRTASSEGGSTRAVTGHNNVTVQYRWCSPSCALYSLISLLRKYVLIPHQTTHSSIYFLVDFTRRKLQFVSNTEIDFKDMKYIYVKNTAFIDNRLG